jgi:hypothetical protein
VLSHSAKWRGWPLLPRAYWLALVGPRSCSPVLPALAFVLTSPPSPRVRAHSLSRPSFVLVPLVCACRRLFTLIPVCSRSSMHVPARRCSFPCLCSFVRVRGRSDSFVPPSLRLFACSCSSVRVHAHSCSLSPSPSCCRRPHGPSHGICIKNISVHSVVILLTFKVLFT